MIDATYLKAHCTASSLRLKKGDRSPENGRNEHRVTCGVHYVFRSVANARTTMAARKELRRRGGELWRGWEDPDDICATLVFAIEALDWVRGVQLDAAVESSCRPVRPPRPHPGSELWRIRSAI